MLDSQIKNRLFIGTKEIAGYYSNLHTGFQELGVKADFVEYVSHKSGYKQSSRPILVRIIRWFHRMQEFSKTRLVSGSIVRIQDVVKWCYLIFCIVKYDTFIFGYGQTIIRNNRDLPILRIFRKTVIMHMGHGSEARVPCMDGSIQSHDESYQPSGDHLAALSAKRKRSMTMAERYATYVLGAPYSSSPYATKPFVNLFALGLPYRGDEGLVQQKNTKLASQKTRVLHCPSHPAVKGTLVIRKAINNLKAKGLSIDYVEVINQPNSVVISEIQKCDFVVDQIYCDIPMAGLATESAWYGKASIVGGYELEALKAHFLSDRFPPVFLTSPENIESAIEKMCTDKIKREELARDAQQFVRIKWDCVEIARRYLVLIAKDVPDSWWFNPMDVTYFWGIGLPKSKVREYIRDQYQSSGISSFQLDHRKDYIQFLQEVAGKYSSMDG